MGNTRGSSDPRAAAAARLRRLIPIGVGLVIILIVVLIATAPRSGRGVDAKASTPEATPTTASTPAETAAAEPSEPTKPPVAKPRKHHGEIGRRLVRPAISARYGQPFAKYSEAETA